MRLKFLIRSTAVALFMGAAPALAHHSFAAQYDSQQMMTLTGTIKTVEWTNPHVYVHLEVQDPSGKISTWALEGYPPNTLKRTGFEKKILVVGDTITVTAYKAKDGSNTGAGREVTFKDGTKKFLGPIGR
jgi:hypothetical protein